MESTQQWMFISHQVQMHLNTHSVDEEILRLQISMKNISTVTESKAFQQLVHEWLYRKTNSINNMEFIWNFKQNQAFKQSGLHSLNALHVYVSPSQFQDLDPRCSCRNTSSNPAAEKRDILASEGTY